MRRRPEGSSYPQGEEENESESTVRALPGRPDAAKIPIIAMTANAFAEDVQASLAAGMDAHLSKPFVMQDVLETISRLRAQV